VNPKSNQVSLFIFLILIFGTSCGVQVVASSTSELDTTALLLLDKYAENQDKLLSFMAKYEETMEQDYLNKTGPDSDINGNYNSYSISECRYDGNRASIRQTGWGNIDRSSRSLPKEKAEYFSRLYNGKIEIQYNTATINGIKKYASQINPKPAADSGQKLVRFSHTGLFMGYMEEGDSEERVDATLRKAKSLKVREKPELINGSSCLVIEGVTHKGKYTLWLDPDHGYNIAKVVIERSPGDFYISKTSPLRTGWKIDYSIQDVRFEKINENWVPLELTTKYNQINPNGYRKYRLHIKRTAITFNPDFTNAFVPDDIPDGSTLIVLQGASKIPFGTNYTWKNGKPCDKKWNPLDFSE
jgi:hypothetical protein